MAAPFLEVDVSLALPGFELAASLTTTTPSVVLFGPSGAGKSLLLESIAGLLRPDRGRVALRNRVLFDREQGVDLPPQKRRVGLVFQHYALFPHLTVEDNLAFGLPGARRGDERVRNMAGTLRLEPLLAARPGQLSGGERQRVAVGRALLPSPDLLLLDEPFSALDTTRRERLRWDLLEITARLEMPTVFVTHDLEEAYLMGRELAVLEGGRVLQAGPRDEVLFRPRDRLVARLTAMRNVFAAEVRRAGEEGRVAIGDTELCVPSPGGSPGDEVLLAIRPEHIRLVRAERSQGKPNLLRATIVEELFTGIQHQLFLRVDGWDRDRRFHLRGTLPDHPYRTMHLGVDQRVLLSLPPDRIQVLE
ncbi:MAG: ABC transporter ATP-binding protein [Deltaproteobacteria bacterium]|jgi:molybdate transport system ATP-binding protein|nr:ABC transporter ATP-binding protein [Deltaproteobacteria bacterium]MBW2534007.1 ABC transporter ATP-binding protein [Deltaproteobacteria bacterium]